MLPQKKILNVLVPALLAAGLLVGCSDDDDDDEVASFSEGVALAAHPLAAEIGAQIPEAGGNAVLQIRTRLKPMQAG